MVDASVFFILWPPEQHSKCGELSPTGGGSSHLIVVAIVLILSFLFLIVGPL